METCFNLHLLLIVGVSLNYSRLKIMVLKNDMVSENVNCIVLDSFTYDGDVNNVVHESTTHFLTESLDKEVSIQFCCVCFNLCQTTHKK